MSRDMAREKKRGDQKTENRGEIVSFASGMWGLLKGRKHKEGGVSVMGFEEKIRKGRGGSPVNRKEENEVKGASETSLKEQ